MNPRTLLRSAGLFTLVYLALLAWSLYFGNEYARLLLPLYRWELDLWSQDYQIQSLMLQDDHGENVVALSLLTKYAVIGGRVVPPGVGISCSTLLGHVLQHPLLVLSLVFAWPATTFRRRLAQLCCAIPFLLLVELLDVPFVLLGSVRDLLISNLAAENDVLMIGWMNFLNGGGRPALSLFAAMLAVVCSRYFSPDHSHKSVRH